MARAFTKTKAILPVLFGLLFLGGALAGCGGTYTPRSDGQCNKGRVWVPPVKNEAGEWTAGYCKWENQ